MNVNDFFALENGTKILRGKAFHGQTFEDFTFYGVMQGYGFEHVKISHCKVSPGCFRVS